MNTSTHTPSVLAWVPSLIFRSHRPSLTSEAAAFLLGVGLLTAAAQIALPLPWTPVPLTGQTFGVLLLALLWGRNRALAAVGAYLALGAFGFPVFAKGGSGLLLGPTLGYLVGMVLAAGVVGTLADRGSTRSFLRALATACLGTVLIWGVGLSVLSAWVPSETLLSAGLWPFLPGDLLKAALAASIASRPVFRAS